MGFVKRGDVEKISIVKEPDERLDDEKTAEKLEEVKKELKTTNDGNNSELSKTTVN